MANPTAPTIGTATRNSDSKFTLTWTNHSGSSASAKYTKLRIYMYSPIDGSYIQYKDLTYSGQTSYSASWLWVADAFRFKVRAYNASGGYATSGYSNTIYTTPNAPSNLKGTYNATQVAVNLSWRSNDDYGWVSGYLLDRYHSDTGTWETVGIDEAVTSYTDNSPYLVGDVKYRIRAKVPSGLTSSYSNVATVLSLRQPAPPTILTPADGQALVSNQPVVLKWKYNSLDGTTQTGFKYMVADNPDFTGGTAAAAVSNAEEATIDYGLFALGTRNYVSLQTEGLWRDGSHGYSEPTVVSFYYYNAPNVTVTSPYDEDVVSVLPLSVLLWYSDAQSLPLTKWQVGISKDGQQVAYKESEEQVETSGNPPHAYIDVPFDDFIPDNNSEYVITATITNSMGFTDSTTSTFTTDYQAPDPPVVTLEESDGCSVDITVTDGGGEVTAQTFNIVRNDGTTIAAGIASGDTATDILAPLDQEVVYSVYGYALGGAAAVTESAITLDSGGSIYVNYGAGYTDFVPVQMDLTWSDSTDHKRGLYVVRGKRDPVVRTTHYRKRSISATGTLWNKEPGQDLAILRNVSGKVFLRIPMGDVIPCVMDISEAFVKGKPLDSVDIKFTQVADD